MSIYDPNTPYFNPRTDKGQLTDAFGNPVNNQSADNAAGSASGAAAAATAPTYTTQPNPQDSPQYPTYERASYEAPDGGSWSDANPYKDRNDSLYDILMGRATQSPNVTRKDPIVRAQADAFSAQQDRSTRNYISDTAEKMGPLANIQGERRMATERAGQATGAFEAQLMGRELEARRNEIQMALAQMGNMLSEDQRLALQRELGLLQNSLGKYGLDVQQNLGVRSQDVDLYKALMGNQQFYSDLGLQASNDWAYWNDPMRDSVSRYR